MYKKSIIFSFILYLLFIYQLQAAILVTGETLKLNKQITIANGKLTIEKIPKPQILNEIKHTNKTAISEYDIDTDDDFRHALKIVFNADKVEVISKHPDINHLNEYDFVFVSKNQPKFNSVIVSDNAVYLISGSNSNTKEKAPTTKNKQKSPHTHISSTAKLVDTSLVAAGQSKADYTIFSDGNVPTAFQNIVQVMQARMSNKSCPKRVWVVVGGYGIIGVDSIAGTAYFISGKEPVDKTIQYTSIIKKTGANKFYANIAYNLMALDSAKQKEILNGPLGNANLYYLPPTGKNVVPQKISNNFKNFMAISNPVKPPVYKFEILDVSGTPLHGIINFTVNVDDYFPFIQLNKLQRLHQEQERHLEPPHATIDIQLPSLPQVLPSTTFSAVPTFPPLSSVPFSVILSKSIPTFPPYT